MSPKVLNPWGLSLSQVDVMDAICETGLETGAAIRLKVSVETIHGHVWRIRQKMGPEMRLVQMAIAWDRWRQGEGKGVPA